MSAMTAPMGRRRTQAAICSGVGKLISGSTPRIKSGGGGGRRLTVRGSARWRGFGVYAGGCADDPDFECLGKERAPGDAREDQGDIAGAERVGIGAERDGDLPAVVDEPADEAEEAAGAAGFGVGGLSGGHAPGEHRTGVRVKEFFPGRYLR
jgi:hypothetical protein